jgi:hypothetical protein
MNKIIIILIIGVLLFIVTIFAVAKLPFFKKSSIPKKDGFINMYNGLPNAYEKKLQLFGSGTVEEVSGNFGIKEGYFAKRNTQGDGWVYVKNGFPIVWDGTKDGPIMIYSNEYTLNDKDAERYGLGASSLTEDGLVAYISSVETSRKLECFTSFPVHVLFQKLEDIDPTRKGETSTSRYTLYLPIEIPNTIVEQADVEDLIEVFSFVHRSIMENKSALGELSSSDEISDFMKMYTQEKIRGGPINELLKSKVLAPNLSAIRMFAEDPKTYETCESKNLSPEFVASRVPTSIRSAIIAQQEILRKKTEERLK